MSSERVLYGLGETRDRLSAKASGGVVQVVKPNRVSVDNTEENRDIVFVPSTESINSAKITKTLKHARVETARLNKPNGGHEDGNSGAEGATIRLGRLDSPWQRRTSSTCSPIEDAGENPFFVAPIAEKLAGPIEDAEHNPFLISPRPSSESKIHIKASETQRKPQQQGPCRTKPKLQQAVTDEPAMRNKGVVLPSRIHIPHSTVASKVLFHPISTSTPPLVRAPLVTSSVENIRTQPSTHWAPVSRRASAPDVTKSVDLLADRLAKLSLAAERANLENLSPGAKKRLARRTDAILAIVEEEEPIEEEEAAVEPSACTYAPVPPPSQRSTGTNRGGFALGVVSSPRPSKTRISDLVAIVEEDAVVIESAPKAHTTSKKRTHCAPFPAAAFSEMPPVMLKYEPAPFPARGSNSSERTRASRIPVMRHNGRRSLPEFAAAPRRHDLMKMPSEGPKVPTTEEAQ